MSGRKIKLREKKEPTIKREEDLDLEILQGKFIGKYV